MCKQTLKGVRMNRYATPPGLCLSSSPPEYPEPTADEINARMERVEELARAEIVACADRFVDWLASERQDDDQLLTAAKMVSYTFDLGEMTGERQCAMWTAQGRILADYTTYLNEQVDV
jgi:hypothetical protein